MGHGYSSHRSRGKNTRKGDQNSFQKKCEHFPILITSSIRLKKNIKVMRVNVYLLDRAQHVSSNLI